MKKGTGFLLLVLAVSLLPGWTSAPALGACGSAAVIATTSPDGTKSFLWTAGVFTPDYYIGYPGYGPAMYPGGNPPVTAAFDASFWALGSGDPSLGAGDDSGGWFWDNGISPWFFYYALPTYSFYESAQIFTNWGAASAIDGCLFNSGPTGGPDPGQECTCMLLTDQDGVTGYYAILGNSTNAVSDTYYTQPGTDGNGNGAPIVLQPIPRVRITNAVLIQPGSGQLALTVRVAENPGDYILDPGICGGCGPSGYRVVQQVIPHGSPPPGDRELALWDLPNLPGGAAQGITPLGDSVTIESPCGDGMWETYLATALYFDSGYVAGVVSADSTRIECGPTLAEPIEAERPTSPRNLRPGRAGPKTKR